MPRWERNQERTSQAVQLRVVDKDRFGRTVAEIYRQGRSINLETVTEGQAVVY